MQFRRNISFDWFRIGGGILALWAFANTYLDITRYGIEQGFYWWFCNLALIGVAGGLLTKHRGWLTGFLSIACFTQVFWVIDNQYRLFTGKNLFGLVEFMYQPGLPLDEFLLSHYHYFTIPISVVALFYLPPRKSNAMKLIMIFNPFIFAVSYFAFPKVQNINCIHEPCFPGLVQWAGPTYSILFWASIFAVHLFIGSRLERYFSTVKVSQTHRRVALQGFLVVTFLAVSLALWDTKYKLSLPALTCLDAKTEDPVYLKCRYTLDYAPNIMVFNYVLKNSSSAPQLCSTKMKINGTSLVMDEGVILSPNEEKKMNVLLNYPATNSQAVLGLDCMSTVRQTAGEKK